MEENRNEKIVEEVHVVIENEKKDGTVFMAIAWVLFALAFVPFLPFKTAFAAAGIVLGYIYKSNYGGSSAPFVANLIMLVFRLAWVFILAAFIAAL